MKKKSKSVIQIKTKLRNLKDCYKQAKHNNAKLVLGHVTTLSIMSLVKFLELGMQ